MREVDETFARDRKRLADLRRCNTTVDEICRDYDELATLLGRGVEDGIVEDIKASLAGLEAELRHYLIEDPT